MSPETLVLIPNYNGRKFLSDSLGSLRNQTYRDFKTLVVDDFSTEDDVNFIHDNFPEVEVLALKKNGGFAKSVNAGLKYILEKYPASFVALMNNDTKADKDWLLTLIGRIKTDGSIASVTSNMFFYDHPETINSQGGTVDWNGDGYDANFGMPEETGRKESTEVFGACFGASLLSVEALKKIGLIDEKFSAYFEDLDWSWRAHLSGYKIFFEKNAVIYHRHSGSYKDKNYRKLYLCKKNALRTALKNWGIKNLPKEITKVMLGYFFAIVGYFQTSKYNMPLRKKIAYSSIPFAAFFWNIIHLPSALKQRIKIQASRKIGDEEILALMNQDSTPVRVWLKAVKRKLTGYPRSIVYHAKKLWVKIFPGKKMFGLNIFGFLDSESGVGEAGRSLVRAVKVARIPYALLSSGNVPHRRKDTSLSREFKKKNPYSVNAIAIYGDMFEEELERFGKEKFENKYNIAYWAWELENLPESWARLLDKVNEVWVPSSFTKNSILKAKDIPVTVVPHSIFVGPRPYGRDHFGIPKDEFVFLFMFDFYSLFERKNPLAVVEAFKKAFHQEDRATLVIKCSNPEIDPENFKLLTSNVDKLAGKGKIIAEYLDRTEINSLLNIADSYVSLHRSEGFGLTVAEAMFLGKPVIATNYSGNTDIINEENGFLVDFKLVEIDKDYGPYTKGQKWAEPNTDDAARLMRLVFENEEIRRRRSLKAREYATSVLSPESIGEIIKNRLLEIRN